MSRRSTSQLPTKPTEQHRQADRHAQEDQRQQDRERQQPDFEIAQWVDPPDAARPEPCRRISADRAQHHVAARPRAKTAARQRQRVAPPQRNLQDEGRFAVAQLVHHADLQAPGDHAEDKAEDDLPEQFDRPIGHRRQSRLVNMSTVAWPRFSGTTGKNANMATAMPASTSSKSPLIGPKWTRNLASAGTYWLISALWPIVLAVRPAMLRQVMTTSRSSTMPPNTASHRAIRIIRSATISPGPAHVPLIRAQQIPARKSDCNVRSSARWRPARSRRPVVFSDSYFFEYFSISACASAISALPS